MQGLSVNSMQMWLRFDKNRSKLLCHEEIKEMVEVVMGTPPTSEFMDELYLKWDLPDRRIDFKKWNALVPMKSNELELRQTFRQIESEAIIRKNKKQQKQKQIEAEKRPNTWAKDLVKQAYSSPTPQQVPKAKAPKGPQGLFVDQYRNEFRIEGRTIVGLDGFDGLRVEANQSLILSQKGKEFKAIYDENEIVWEDGDVWKRKEETEVENVAVNRRPQGRQMRNLDGGYLDQFGNRFTIDHEQVLGIDNFEGLDASEGGTVFLHQAGQKYRGKYDPKFGINWQDGDIWKKDPPGNVPAVVEMGVRTHPREIEMTQTRKKIPTLTDLQGSYQDQLGNMFHIDGTRIYGLKGFERMSANPRGLVIYQDGVEFRATYDSDKITWEDGDVWAKIDDSNVGSSAIDGAYIDQYNNMFTIKDSKINGLDGFQGLDVFPDGRLELRQKNETYGADYNPTEIVWDDEDIWKKSHPVLEGFGAGQYRLLHAAAVTASFTKESEVEKELLADEMVDIEVIVSVDDRIRGKIAGSGWVSMHSPQQRYTWVEPADSQYSSAVPVPTSQPRETARGPSTVKVAPRPEMYSDDAKVSGVWQSDDGTGVATDSFVDFNFTPDSFRFIFIFVIACFFSFCAIVNVLAVDDWDWNDNVVQQRLGFNTFSLLYQYEPVMSYLGPPVWCVVVISLFLYIMFQWVRVLMLRRNNYISKMAMELYSFACILEIGSFCCFAMALSVPPEKDITWHIFPLIVFQIGTSIAGWKNYYYYVASAGNAKVTRNTGNSIIYCFAMAGWNFIALWNVINLGSRLDGNKAPLPVEEVMQIIWCIMLGTFMILGCGMGDSSETFAISIDLKKSR